MNLFSGAEIGRCVMATATPLNEAELIARLQARIESERRVNRDLMDAHNAIVSEKNAEIGEKIATILRQEEEIAKLNRELRTAKARRHTENHSTLAIPKQMWRLLMQLTHPDRHDNSPGSQAAAKWLNANRPQ
jgi:hypothetical protein